jgi:hypothetical protein
VKMKMLTRLVISIGVVALSATLAHAGGGMGGNSEIGGAFQCYLINGVNQPHVVNTEDVTTPEADGGTSAKFDARTNVKIGKARLVCAPVMVTLAEGSTPFDTGDDTYPSLVEHFKCYDASDNRLVARPQVTTWDAIDVEDLRVGEPVFLCIPSAVTPPRPPTP